MIMSEKTVTDSDVVPVLTVEARKREWPALITRLVLGAKVINPWHGLKDVFTIDDVYGKRLMSKIDFTIARAIADQIVREFDLQKIVPAHEVLNIRERAQDLVESMTDERAGKSGIIMLKDRGGCGYWRTVLPSRYIETDGLYIDVTGGAVDYNHLLEYQTIFVQRVHNWESVEVLRRLKKLGKRIVYDIDDDLFSIPESNPAHNSMGRSEQMAALECMKMASVVTTTTTALQERLTQMLDGISPVVIPNAYEFDSSWLRTELTGSPDGFKRIFWQGSNTHDLDWSECFEAVDALMRMHDNLKMVILGFLPTMIQKSLNEKHWKGRVEYLGPMEPEAYFQLIRHVRADVGLAPLESNWFNEAKSPIKWIENSMIGMPTVASNVRAYSDVIKNGHDGYLCCDTQDWIAAIDSCLVDKDLRLKMLANARSRVINEFDIKTVAQTWRNILLG
jgi:glycosyltransferase involved in cell wall biosynthesis